MQDPETRASLIAGLTDPAAEEVWAEFVGIYRPLIYRVARAKGLQDADAEDVTQAVFGRVQRAIASFESQGPGSFRRWLYAITRNLVVTELTRGPFSGRRGPVATGDSEVIRQLEQVADADEETTAIFRLEYQRVRFQMAAEKVREQISETTWMCFWLTSVKHRSVKEIAEELGRSVGAVRVARCRVLTKIREEIAYDPLESEE
ncbi:sigma-70 family RNA polymerase sigma factor [Novipirellula rosea]|uniref:Sigma-70 family RNA polymerase sigma factor n=1 Tax=Novipirellula rosea TaxID=1031540 RepID=A0ABP8MMI2_9BACT